MCIFIRFFFIFYSIINVSDFSSHQLIFSQPEIKKGYVDWHNKFCNLFFSADFRQRCRDVGCTAQFNSLYHLSLVSYLRNIHNANNYELLPKLISTTTEQNPPYIKYLYSIATLEPIADTFHVLAQSASLKLLQNTPRSEQQTSIDYRYKATCSYVAIKNYTNNQTKYLIFDTQRSIETPAYNYIVPTEELSLSRSCKAQINNVYFAISHGNLLNVINHATRENISFLEKHSNFYLSQQNNHLLFIAQKKKIIVLDMQSSKQESIELLAPITYMGVFEKKDDTYVLEIRQNLTIPDTYQSFYYDAKNKSLTKLAELSHGDADCSYYTHIEQINNSWYLSQDDSTTTINDHSAILTKIEPRTSEELALDPEKISQESHLNSDFKNFIKPQSITYIDKDINCGHSLLKLDVDGFLFSYTDKTNKKIIPWHGQQRACNFYSGIALRFPLDQQNVMEFKFGSYKDKYIEGIYRTEHPATFIIQVEEQMYPEPNTIEYFLLHFPLVQKYSEITTSPTGIKPPLANNTENIYPITDKNSIKKLSKYEKRLIRIYFLYNAIKSPMLHMYNTLSSLIHNFRS